MTASVGLKPPPKFVKSPWAWAYTLHKLRTKQDEDGKQRLDEGGNPLNYAAAISIYKASEKKYAAHVAAGGVLPGVIVAEQPDRAQMIAMQAPVWTVAHDSAWSANGTAHQRLFYDGERWLLQRFEESGESTFEVDADTASWLVQGSEQAALFVGAK